MNITPESIVDGWIEAQLSFFSLTFNIAVDIDHSPQGLFDVDILTNFFFLSIENVMGAATTGNLHFVSLVIFP